MCYLLAASTLFAGVQHQNSLYTRGRSDCVLHCIFFTSHSSVSAKSRCQVQKNGKYLGCMSPQGWPCTLHKNASVHQVITVLATSKNVLFPGHNHLLTTSTDEPPLVTWWWHFGAVVSPHTKVIQLIRNFMYCCLVSMTSIQYLPWVRSLSNSCISTSPTSFIVLMILVTIVG